MRKGSFTLAIVLLLVACSSTAPQSEEELVSNLPTLQQIATIENAERALVISQQIRVIARDQLAISIKADGVITEAERAKATTFDRYDTYFTDAWRIMDRGVTAWKLTGQRSPDIDQAYAALLNAILKPTGLRDLPDGDSNG